MEIKNIYKAPKGLIRVDAELNEGRISKIRITGDFFMVPEDSLPSLEKILQGTAFERKQLEKKLDDFYKTGVTTPMLSKDDIINAIVGAK